VGAAEERDWTERDTGREEQPILPIATSVLELAISGISQIN